MEKSRAIATISLFLIAAAITPGCASRPCREPKAPEMDLTAPGRAAAPPAAGTGVSSETPSDHIPKKLRVYKPDGSRQCERRGAIATDAMERELAGIPVHSREKRRDGLMHIQVCGSPTGMINLYEIDTNNLKQAEERGFKRWED